jgi:hypothetical protein
MAYDDIDDHITVVDAENDMPLNLQGGHDQWTDDQMNMSMNGGNQLDLMEQQLMTLWNNARAQQSGGNCSANNQQMPIYNGNNTMQSMPMMGGNCGADNNFGPMQPMMGTSVQESGRVMMGGNCSATNWTAPTASMGMPMMGGNCSATNWTVPMASMGMQPMMGGNCSATNWTAPTASMGMPMMGTSVQESERVMMGGNCSAMGPVGLSTSLDPIQPWGMSSSGHQVYQVMPSAMTMYGGYRTRGSKNRNSYTGATQRTYERRRGSVDSQGKAKRPPNEAFMAFQNLVAYMKQMDEFSQMKRKDVIHLAKKVMDTSKAQLGDDASVADRLALAKKLVKENPSKYDH